MAGTSTLQERSVRSGSAKPAPLRFLGAETPHDHRSARVVDAYRHLPPDIAARLRTGNLMVDAPDERIASQTWRILANVAARLADHPLGLASIVHQRYFLRDMRDRPALEKAMRACFGEWLPSTTIVEADAPGLDPAIAVHADFVAVADDSKLVPRNVSLPALNALTAPYPLATRAGPYVFTTPIAGVDVRSGVPLRRIAELPVEEQALADPPYSVLGEEAAVQQVVAFRHIEAVLRAQGSSLAWQVRQNGWMQLPMRDFGPASRMRARLFAGRAAALTSVQVRGIRNPGALFEYGVFAVVPGADDDAPVRELPSHAHGMADYYVGAVRAGAYVLTAGEVPVDVARPGPIRGFGDLEAALRALAASRVDACGPVLAQATYVYAKLADALRSVGADMQDVVHQTVYVTDARDCAAIERVATLYFGADLPATTVVPIVGTSPYAESRLEIELVAYGVDRRPPFTS